MPTSWSTLDVVREQFKHLPPLKDVNLTGRTAIVTGASLNSLGWESAKWLALQQASKVILACRSQEKGEEAVAAIKIINSNVKVEFWLLDLNSFESIHDFSKKAIQELDRLDVLLLNAGVASNKFEKTEDGFEQTIQTNVAGPVYLALLLEPLLQKAATKSIGTLADYKPHVTFTGSDAHYWAKFEAQNAEKPLAALNDPEQFDTYDRYYTSKLLVMLFCRKLSETFGDGIIVNVASPGFTNTALFRGVPTIVQPILWLFKQVFARSAKSGASVILYAALEDCTPNGYIMSNTVCEPSDFVKSQKGIEVCQRMWSELGEIIRRIPDVELADRIAQ